MSVKNRLLVWGKAVLVTALCLVSGAVLAESLTVRHHMGELSLESSPKRVVVLGHASLDLVDALGIKPVGVVKSLLPDYLKQYQTEQYGSAGSNTEADFEAIYSLKPDLIIAEARMMKVYQELSAIAPTYMFYVEPGHYWRDTQTNWRNLAKLFGKSAEAETLIQGFSQQFTAQHHLSEQQQLTALTVMNNGNNLASFGDNSRFSLVYQELGFLSSLAKNVESTVGPHGNLISFEYIADAAPDVLLVLDREQAIGRSSGRAKSLFNNPLVASTPAAKHQRIVFVDPAAWYLSAGGPRATQIMLDDVHKAFN
ncbi:MULTISPECIES: siderophore ABC transporter substrate-binding protein [unclassified Agarivorans]|uniref:siderophore ABC transporter substrate-binding protein n=1 Tax=unclassified Agarivorans TaxID=2636026 RepID=UPI003D7DD882